MPKPNLPPDFLDKLKRITAKRARTVIDHLLEHGQITSEELKETYGYNHPPRAIRDVREQGIPIETFRVTSSDGRSIAAYRFGDPNEVQDDKLGGRKVLPKALKDQLMHIQDGRCAICNTAYDGRYLQIDHRVPYSIAGDEGQHDIANYMLLCTSCNRAKSWSCEHCENGRVGEIAVCQTCYWANPTDYQHVATQPERRTTLVWQDDDVLDFESLQTAAKRAKMDVRDYIKHLIRHHLMDDK